MLLLTAVTPFTTHRFDKRLTDEPFTFVQHTAHYNLLPNSLNHYFSFVNIIWRTMIISNCLFNAKKLQKCMRKTVHWTRPKSFFCVRMCFVVPTEILMPFLSNSLSLSLLRYPSDVISLILTNTLSCSSFFLRHLFLFHSPIRRLCFFFVSTAFYVERSIANFRETMIEFPVDQM